MASAKQQLPLTKQLLDELRAWCDQERGRQVETANAIGVSKQRVTDWFAGRYSPTSEQALLIQQFLKQQVKRRRKSSPA